MNGDNPLIGVVEQDILRFPVMHDHAPVMTGRTEYTASILKIVADTVRTCLTENGCHSVCGIRFFRQMVFNVSLVAHAAR